MGAIGGIVQFDRKATNASLLDNMMNAMTHRGADTEEVFLSEKHYSLGLGQRWLGTDNLCESKDGQLGRGDNSSLVVFDGRIHNYSDLKEKLERKGYQFTYGNYPELVEYLYQEYGIQCLEHMYGVFTFAVWDRRREKLFIARDRMGVKPLYYYKSKDLFLFASELKAILATALVEKRLNPQAVLGYLTFKSVQDPDTIIQEIYSLLPGHYVMVQKDNALRKSYWEIPLLSDQLYTGEGGENNICKKTRKMLESAVKMEIPGQAPMGVFLSGGIDSTAIVALMSECLTSPMNTFSAIFSDAEHDESNFARLVSKRFNTKHTEFYIDEEEVIADLPEIVGKMDQPSVDGINTYVISKAAGGQGIKVAFSGIGGDDIFVDYDFLKQKLTLINNFTTIWNLLPKPAAKHLLAVLNSAWTMNVTYKKFVDYLDSQTSFVDLYFMTRKVLWKGISKNVLSEEFMRNLNGDVSYETNYVKHLQNNVQKTDDDINKISYLDYKTYVPNTLLRDADCMGMANSMEVRVPLLDDKLVEYVATIPGKFKVDKNVPRKLEAGALEDLLPREVVYRKKEDFTPPFEKWLRSRMRPIVEEALAEKTVNKRGIFNYEKIDQLWQKFLSGRVNWGRIWIFVILELWCQEHVD